MDFRVGITTDNAAFAGMPEMEIARILRRLADRLERDGVPEDDDRWPMMDVNGNRVGVAGFRQYLGEASPGSVEAAAFEALQRYRELADTATAEPGELWELMEKLARGLEVIE
jgi:hypothetical protein